MSDALKTEIMAIVEALKVAKKHHLAECIEQNWQKTALDYSKELNSYLPSRLMEPALVQAFDKELARLDIQEPSKSKILDSLQKRRVIQTAPHLVTTENPRMLTINWLGSLGVPNDEFYVVGMFSGIPFSNSFRPGRINMQNGEINLIPSSMQDDLVYGSKIPEKLIEVVKTLPEEIKKLLPEAQVGNSYTAWAAKACQNIERKILKKENLIYLDINEVVANYLETIKGKEDHPLNKIKSDEKLFITFSALLLNDFKCFGSFRQVEYLPEYQARLAALPFMKDFNIENIPTANLTTGVLPGCAFPADIITGAEFKAGPDILFGELITNMMTKQWLEKSTS